MSGDLSFITQELIKFASSLIGGMILLYAGKGVLERRDRKRQDMEKERIKLNDLRKELVHIFNQYYKVRKRYTTVRSVVINKDKAANPYIEEKDFRKEMDSLLVACIDLEARYYTLKESLKVSFPKLWDEKLKLLLECEEIGNDSNAKNEDSLEFYFDSIRDYIEAEKYVDTKLKEKFEAKFRDILTEFNRYEDTKLRM